MSTERARRTKREKETEKEREIIEKSYPYEYRKRGEIFYYKSHICATICRTMSLKYRIYNIGLHIFF